MFIVKKSVVISREFPLVDYRAAKLRLLNFLSLFRDLQKPTRLSGGGGSSRIFP